MTDADKRVSPDPRVRRTERAVLLAARELFEQQGYAATTMAQIAERAECAERTLFLRFSSKALLLQRLVDETLAGSVSGAAQPDPRRTAMLEAPTLEERLRAFAEGTADALVRTGPMFAVAREAEASEPVIAAAFDAGRRGSMRASRRLWQRLADDGLLHPGVDVDWVAQTAGLLASPDTYLVQRTTLGWSRDALAAWLYRTWTHLATTPGPPAS
ncbi:TetR/AcrR family transcriptional regulator [Phycicoccus avicenniae]|uniref:TetR/AcrR family transcriptional regulator n=1 Tax=Phycicoccus avicenniae TaxID=2828860 RepID=UPI003D2B3B1D